MSGAARGDGVRRIAVGLVVLLVAASIVFPFAWLLLASLKVNAEIIGYPPTLMPKGLTLGNYLRVGDSIPLLRFFANTIVFAGGVTAISVLVDAMAGYAFARLRFKGRRALFVAVLLTMMVPFQVIMIPLFVEVYRLKLLDTFWGLILPRAASAFGIFMMRSFFVSIPRDFEEAARIDGLGEYRIFSRIMLPQCSSALATLVIFDLVNNWNDLLYPLMLTSSTEMRTLSAGLAMFVGDKVIEYGPTLAAATVSILPLLLVYLFAQKYFVQSVAMSGLKG